jgi:integrase/recombinase XerD
LRIGELLKIKVADVSDPELILRGPKSGKESELASMPEQIARRLREYIQQRNSLPEDRISPICCYTARALVRKLDGGLNVVLTPHELRRYSATHA